MRTSPRTALWAAFALVLAGLVGVALSAPSPDVPGRGNDISWPQCAPGGSSDAGPLPGDSAFGIVGTQNGKPNTANPCLNREWTWALGRPGQPMLYLLTGNPGPTDCGDTSKRQLPGGECDRWTSGSSSNPPRPCSGSEADDGCAYDYGWQAGLNALANADAAQVTVAPTTWWIDVEPRGYFRTQSNRKAQNVAALQGTVDALLSRSADRVARVGFYSSPSEWKDITGDDRTTFAALPFWYPVGSDGPTAALSKCGGPGPHGGRVEMVQWVAMDEAVGKTFDADARCTSPLAITALSSTVRTGTPMVVAGTAAPGAQITIHQAESRVPERLVVSTQADPNTGAWAAQVVQRTNGYLTVRDGSSAVSRRVSVIADVGITTVRGVGRTRSGLCRVRLDGGADPWVPGQIVLVKQGSKKLGYAHTRLRSGGVASWSMVLSVRCGKPLSVRPELPGKAGRTTYAITSQGIPRTLKPR